MLFQARSELSHERLVIAFVHLTDGLRKLGRGRYDQRHYLSYLSQVQLRWSPQND